MTDQLQTASRDERDISGKPEDIRDDAIATLWNMSIIAEADMMMQGIYVDEHVTRPERTKSVCGGHRACAIGSLFLGARIPMVYLDNATGRSISKDEMEKRVVDPHNRNTFWSVMPNTNVSDRKIAFQEYPYLGLAYRALNNVAMQYVARKDPQRLIHFATSTKRPFEGPDAGWAEDLFESNIIDLDDLGKVFVKLCDEAASNIDMGYFSDNIAYHGASAYEDN